MRVDTDDVVACPHCHDGLVVSPLPGDEDGLCGFCGGLGFTLKHIRCMCGRQVNLLRELRPGIYFCGRLKCGEGLLKALPPEPEVQGRVCAA